MNKKQWNYLIDLVTEKFPNASLEYDNDGQLIIYTGEYDPDEAFDPQHDWTRESNE
tara:strand:+ start:130 stop:297 length:168 start_codon:yes stop_codon:yes gene_type:complete